MVLFSYEPLTTIYMRLSRVPGPRCVFKASQTTASTASPSGLPQLDELIAMADVTRGGLCPPSHR